MSNFKDRLETGEDYEERLAQALANELAKYKGFLVQRTVKPSPAPPGWFTANQSDIWVINTLTGRFVTVEVKSRKVTFTNDPASFPYATAFVDKASTYDAKVVLPFASLYISQITEAVLVIPGESKPAWTLTSKWDSVQQRQMPNAYECPKEHLWSYRTFLRRLRDWLEYGE